MLAIDSEGLESIDGCDVRMGIVESGRLKAVFEVVWLDSVWLVMKRMGRAGIEWSFEWNELG